MKRADRYTARVMGIQPDQDAKHVSDGSIPSEGDVFGGVVRFALPQDDPLTQFVFGDQGIGLEAIPCPGCGCLSGFILEWVQGAIERTLLVECSRCAHVNQEPPVVLAARVLLQEYRLLSHGAPPAPAGGDGR